MIEVFAEQIGTEITNGRSYDIFMPSGPKLDHRGHFKQVVLLVGCDLTVLDQCLQRLPQDKKRLGFRLNVGLEPWMLKPNGNWAEARISRTDGKRLGWKPTHYFVAAEGICLGLNGPTIKFFRLSHKEGWPRSVLLAEAIARACIKFNANPSAIQEFAVDAATHCMCCGKGLSVEQSRVRGVGPECLSILNTFLGVDETVAEIEANPLPF